MPVSCVSASGASQWLLSFSTLTDVTVDKNCQSLQGYCMKTLPSSSTHSTTTTIVVNVADLAVLAFLDADEIEAIENLH